MSGPDNIRNVQSVQIGLPKDLETAFTDGRITTTDDLTFDLDNRMVCDASDADTVFLTKQDGKDDYLLFVKKDDSWQVQQLSKEDANKLTIESNNAANIVVDKDVELPNLEIYTGDAEDNVVINGLVGTVDLGNGPNKITIGAQAAVSKELRAGTGSNEVLISGAVQSLNLRGTNHVRVANTGDVTSAKFAGGADQIQVAGHVGSLDAGNGRNLMYVDDGATIDDLRGGQDQDKLYAKSGSKIGKINVRDGEDSFVYESTEGWSNPQGVENKSKASIEAPSALGFQSVLAPQVKKSGTAQSANGTDSNQNWLQQLMYMMMMMNMMRNQYNPYNSPMNGQTATMPLIPSSGNMLPYMMPQQPYGVQGNPMQWGQMGGQYGSPYGYNQMSSAGW